MNSHQRRKQRRAARPYEVRPTWRVTNKFVDEWSKLISLDKSVPFVKPCTTELIPVSIDDPSAKPAPNAVVDMNISFDYKGFENAQSRP